MNINKITLIAAAIAMSALSITSFAASKMHYGQPVKNTSLKSSVGGYYSPSLRIINNSYYSYTVITRQCHQAYPDVMSIGPVDSGFSVISIDDPDWSPRCPVEVDIETTWGDHVWSGDVYPVRDPTDVIINDLYKGLPNANVNAKAVAAHVEVH